MRMLSASLMFVVILACTVAMASVSGAELEGKWAGVYTLANQNTAVQVEFHSRDQAIKGVVDIIALYSALSLTSLQLTADGFTAELERPEGKILFHGRLDGPTLKGTVKQGSSAGTFQLVRLATLDLKGMRSWEGIYRAGRRTFLIERLTGDWVTIVELHSGTIRNLFAVGANELVGGPTLLAAQPEELRLKFTGNGSNAPVSLVITERGKDFTATQVPLRREEVVFHNGDVKLAGTLILPTTAGQHAAVVFTHGSGAAIRQSFFGLGFLLASKGIAVLKYDKRGSGESTGNLRGSSFVDLADDAVAGARLLTGHSEIDPKRVGFWGLSQGSSIAPLAASRFPGTGFVMAASGGGLSIDQWELLEGEDQLRTDGHFSEADIVEALAFERTRDHYLKTKEGWEEYAAARKNAEGKAWYDYPTTDFFGPTDRDDSYWTDTAKFYFYDGVPALSTLRCPFLGIFGAWDTPSSDERNVGAYRAALTAAGNKDVTLRILPGGNHDLFETASGNARELPQAKRFVPEFFPLILGWLKEHGFFTPR